MLNVAVQMFLPSSDAAASFAWIADAAVLMLKNKIHRIPIVNESNQLVGIVTRTDIFTAMETSE
jgi:predicted transcriptional regulator